MIYRARNCSRLKDFSFARNFGYLGFFLASYFGGSLFMLLFLVKTLNPLLLVIIGAAGNTLDEFFAWYAGNVSETLDKSKKWHSKVQKIIEKYGFFAIFMLGLLPVIPNFIYTIFAFTVGHYKMSFLKYFLINFTAKFIRTAVIIYILLKIV